MAANMPKTLRQQRAGEMAQTMFKNHSGKDKRTKQAKEKDNQNYYRQERNGTYDRNNNHQRQDYRNGGYGATPDNLENCIEKDSLDDRIDIAKISGQTRSDWTTPENLENCIETDSLNNCIVLEKTL